MTVQDVTNKIDALDREAMLLGDDKINRRRTLTAASLVLRDHGPCIINGGCLKYLEWLKGHCADNGNLNYAAGIEHVQQWIKSLTAPSGAK